MTQRRTLLALAAIPLLSLQPHDVPAASPHHCATVTDDSERLACYDRTFGTPAAPKPLPDPPAAGRPEPVPERFTATISKIEWRNGVFVVTLDNGQTWIQSERDSRIQLEPQESVTVRRASLGSYLLAGKQGIAARVRRLR